MKAKETLEKVVTKKTGFFTRFRSRSNDLKDLKAHQEKLKTLCPILSLAITTAQQTHPPPQQPQPPLKRRRVEGDVHGEEGSQGSVGDSASDGGSPSSPNRRVSGEGQGFDAARLLKNEETRDFWLHHFGAKVRNPFLQHNTNTT